jgi:tRNA/rRNA methyltransferase
MAETFITPAIILVETQLGENIGAAARAMANFGLADLRLVAPRDGWPNEAATRAASRADHVLGAARVFATLAEAIEDCGTVLATTARPRGFVKPVIGPAEAARDSLARAGSGVRTGILFGRERIGLMNDEIALADAIVTLPIDPRFASLNIAQAVLILAYEWRLAATGGALPFAAEDRSPPATKADLLGLFEHLEAALDAATYFRPPEMRSVMARNLRGILQKAGLTTQEVRTLRGVVAALEGRQTRPPRPRGPDRTPPKDRSGR